MKNYYLIDLFCGAGGVTTGASFVEGVHVLACVNHDANAIKSHAENHPDCIHYTEDIRTLNLDELISHVERIRTNEPDAIIALWASLECTNFSRAKGGLPRNADSRTLADHLIEKYKHFELSTPVKNIGVRKQCRVITEPGYIPALMPDLVFIENVEEFMSWGPLDENGKPVSKMAGCDYVRWRDAIKSGYNYQYDHRILNAADYGAYTSRKRFFAQFAQPYMQMEWPVQTHARANKLAKDLFGSDLKPWKPVRDILRLSEHGASIFGRKKNLSDKTYERIWHGLVKFVAGGKSAFLSKYHGGAVARVRNRNQDVDDTIGTLDTNNRYSIVTTLNARNVNNTSVNEPSNVVLTDDRKALVSAQFISKQFSGHPESKNVDINDAAPTVKPIDNNLLISPNFIVNYQHSSKANGLHEPSPTITTRDKYAFVSAYYTSGSNNHSLNSPSPTMRTKASLALVQAEQFIARDFSGGGQIADINEPAGTVMPFPKLNLVSAEQFLVDTQFQASSNRAKSLDEPIGSQTANRKHYYLMNPQYLNAGRSIDDPAFTLIARMDKMPPYLVETETGQVAIQVEQGDSEYMIKIKEFMALYGIVDIKMRMLFIDELLKIQGFPEKYVLHGTQAERKKYIGNSVEVNQAKVLIEASFKANFQTQLTQVA